MGNPVGDDATLFWISTTWDLSSRFELITISQRENFRAAFDQFDYKKIAICQRR
jgi:DNA-3-methyladenine glycosylase I